MNIQYYYMDKAGKIHKTPEFEVAAMHGWWHVEDWITKRIRVSTVFVLVDHSFGRSDHPILFETMIFGGKRSGETYRYSSQIEAQLGHTMLVAELKMQYAGRKKKEY